MVESGEISTRGLKPDAKKYGEMIIDVNIIMIVVPTFVTFGAMEGGFPTAQPLGGVGCDYSPLVPI